MVDLGEIGILRVHPEERETGDPPLRLHLAGHGYCCESLVEGIERTSEESNLLTGHHHHRLGVAQARDALQKYIPRSPRAVLIGEDSHKLIAGVAPAGQKLKKLLLRLPRVPSIKIAECRRPF